MEPQEVLPENISGSIERLAGAVNDVRRSDDKARHLKKVFERMDDRPDTEILEKQTKQDCQAILNIVDLINELSTKIIHYNTSTNESLDYLHIKLK